MGVVDSRHRRALPIGRDGRVIDLKLGNPVEGDNREQWGGRLMARWEEGSKYAVKLEHRHGRTKTRFEPRVRHQYKSAWPHHLGSGTHLSSKQASAKTDDASYRLLLPRCRWSAIEPTNKCCWVGSIYCTYVAMTSKVPGCISDKKAIAIAIISTK